MLVFGLRLRSEQFRQQRFIRFAVVARSRNGVVGPVLRLRHRWGGALGCESELEWRSEIFANVWQTGRIDLKELSPQSDRRGLDVLDGIAYFEEDGRSPVRSVDTSVLTALRA